MGRGKKVFLIVLAVLLFAVVQIASDNAVGSLDWFFRNLPPHLTPDRYPVMNFLANPYMDFFFSWLPVVCLSFSILLFLSHKVRWGFLLIAAPLVPAIFMTVMFYNAAQIHVPPGESLYSSGVLVGKAQSPVLAKETENED